MRFPLWILATVPALLFAVGCASQNPTPEQASALRTLTPPSNYQAKITDMMSTILKDPYSAHYRFDPPQKAYFTTGLVYNKGVTGIGHTVIAHINAKNGFGGYTGEQTYYFALYENGQVQMLSADEYNLFSHRYTD
jgi:hypothetical protein